MTFVGSAAVSTAGLAALILLRLAVGAVAAETISPAFKWAQSPEVRPCEMHVSSANVRMALMPGVRGFGFFLLHQYHIGMHIMCSFEWILTLIGVGNLFVSRMSTFM